MFEEIKEKIIQEYPVDANQGEVFFLEKKRYLIFWEKIISTKSLISILETIQNSAPDVLSKWKTFIIIGQTDLEFKEDELFYFDNKSTFAVFYLINRQTKSIFKNDRWIFPIGCGYKKQIKKIDKIVKDFLCHNSI